MKLKSNFAPPSKFFLIIHKTKLPRDHVSESGDSRSDTCIVTPPPVSGLTHNKTLHPASHSQGKLLTQLYSNVYPLCIPSFPFPTLVPQIFFSFEVKNGVGFCKLSQKNTNFSFTTIHCIRAAGWVVPSYRIFSPLLGGVH